MLCYVMLYYVILNYYVIFVQAAAGFAQADAGDDAPKAAQ